MYKNITGIYLVFKNKYLFLFIYYLILYLILYLLIILKSTDFSFETENFFNNVIKLD